jgi:hypothetical protein
MLVQFCQYMASHPRRPIKTQLISWIILATSAFFLKKMFRGTLSLTQENHHFIVQIRKNNAVNGQSGVYGGVVVKVLRHKLEGCGIDSRWCQNFSLT